MSSARAASELRGLSTASTSDEEEEGECVCSASGGPHLLASCFILSSTLMWNWEEFPPPPMLSSSQTYDEGFCGPYPHKKKTSYMLARGGWPGRNEKLLDETAGVGSRLIRYGSLQKPGPERPEPNFSATEHTVAVSQTKQDRSIYPQDPPAGPVSTSAATLSVLQPLRETSEYYPRLFVIRWRLVVPGCIWQHSNLRRSTRC